MIVYLLRHGEATFDAPTDRDRALTENGRNQVHSLCNKRANDLSCIERVYYSPYKRTSQTADIVCQFLGVPRASSPLLTPSSSFSRALDFIYQTSKSNKAALFVTHQPLIGQLVSALANTDRDYAMGTASLAAFNCDPPVRDCCELSWLQHA